MEIREQPMSRYAGFDGTPDNIIREALAILEARLITAEFNVSKPEDAKAFLTIKLASLESEVFACLWLNNKHKVLAYSELFRGTIDGASVHPREVAKDGLRHNAAAVIFAHNHPSGEPEPSRADIQLTRRLVDSMGLIDIKVLDHMVIGGMDIISFAERGLI